MKKSITMKVGSLYIEPCLFYGGIGGVGFSSVLLQQHHLPRLDEIACLEAVEVETTLLIRQHYFVFLLGSMIPKLYPIRKTFVPPSNKLYVK